jgi:hypothetical protein
MSSEFIVKDFNSLASVTVNSSSWQSGQLPHSTMDIQRGTLHSSVSTLSDRGSMAFSVAVWFPAGQDQTDGKYFKVPDEGQCRITWTTMPTWAKSDEIGPISMDHFSTLPDGWIPIDGADFLIRFLHHLSTRWFNVCDKAEEHLASCVS